MLADGGEELVIGALRGDGVFKAHQPHRLAHKDVETQGVEHLMVAVAAALLVDTHGTQKTGGGTGAPVALTIERTEYFLRYLAVHVTVEQVMTGLRVVELLLRP